MSNICAICDKDNGGMSMIPIHTEYWKDILINICGTCRNHFGNHLHTHEDIMDAKYDLEFKRR